MRLGNVDIPRDTCQLVGNILGHVGDKWAVLIIVLLRERPMRYSELEREIETVSKKSAHKHASPSGTGWLHHPYGHAIDPATGRLSADGSGTRGDGAARCAGKVGSEQQRTGSDGTGPLRRNHRSMTYLHRCGGRPCHRSFYSF